MNNCIAGVRTTCFQQEWTAPDGERFSYSIWESETQPPRAVVVAVHGLSGAALDFEPLGSHLAQEGIATYALELRGQGNDPVAERRGDLVRLDDWYADLRAFFALVRGQHPGAPVYYYGESMGGALLTRFLAQAGRADQPAGLILASPVVKVPGNPTLWRRLVFHVLLFVSPKRRVDVSKYTKRHDENDPKHWVTRDAAHRRWFETASHRITSFTFRFFKCLFDLMGGCMEAAPKLTVPVLLLYASNDVFIPPQVVEDFFSQIGSSNKETKLFQESYHLLLHDVEKRSALACIEDWIRRRLRIEREG
jgi:alpha-beta hydrolase superfamily lysophospholipase